MAVAVAVAVAVAPAMGAERWGFWLGRVRVWGWQRRGGSVWWWLSRRDFMDFTSAAENADIFLLGATSWADPCGLTRFCQKHLSHRSMREQQNKIGGVFPWLALIMLQGKLPNRSKQCPPSTYIYPEEGEAFYELSVGFKGALVEHNVALPHTGSSEMFFGKGLVKFFSGVICFLFVAGQVAFPWNALRHAVKLCSTRIPAGSAEMSVA